MRHILKNVIFLTVGLASLTSCLLLPVSETEPLPVASVEPIQEEADTDRLRKPVASPPELPGVIVYSAPEPIGDPSPKMILPTLEISDVHTPRSPEPRGSWFFTAAVREPVLPGNDLPEIATDRIVGVLSSPDLKPPVMETLRNSLGFYEKVTILLRLEASLPPEMPSYLADDIGSVGEQPDPVRSDVETQSDAITPARDLPKLPASKPEPPAPSKQTTGSDVDRSDNELIGPDRQRILARQGDNIEISFEEKGWVYLGAANREASLSGIAFQGKQIKEGGSVFAFTTSQLGEYELAFLHQDNRAGLQKKVVMDVLVLEESEFVQRLGEEGGHGSTLAFAEELFQAGKKSEALNEYLKFYREGDPFLNDRIAAIYWADREFEKAAVYWKRNRDFPGEFGERAILGIIKSGIALDDRVSLFQNIDAVMGIESVSVSDEVIELARYFMVSEEYPAAKSVLLGLLKRSSISGEHRLGEAYFLLGQLHEVSRNLDDLKEAKRAYSRVIADYPDSPYYSSAEERIRFLNRHFFFLQ